MNQTETITTIYTTLDPVPYEVFRVKVGGGRLYYTMVDDEPRFYISLTTLTRHTLPTSEFLIKWISSMGEKEAKAYMEERAEYGTLMHHTFGEFMMEKKYNFDLTEGFIKNAIAMGVIKYYKEDWIEELNKDVAAFAMFCHDYKVEPLAIELVMVSKDGYGTLIDLVCKMHEEVDGFDYDNPYKSGKRKGQPREIKIKKDITALINFKSGKHGFYEEHEVQLEFERRLFVENYPDIKIDAIYNWAPKDWKGKPSYTLKDQTGQLNGQKADYLLGLAKIELMKKLPNKLSLATSVKYGDAPQVNESSVYDYIKQRHREMAVANNAMES